MNKETLLKLNKEIGDFLKKAGVELEPSKMEELENGLREMQEEKSRRLIAGEVIRQLLNPIKKDDLINAMKEAMKELKIEPQIIVNPPEVNVNAPEPKVIMQEPPKVQVLPPKVTLQERPFPKEMGIAGILGFVNRIVEAIKGKLNIGSVDTSPKNPLYVTLSYAGKAYKSSEEGRPTGLGAAIVGSSPSRVTILGKGHTVVTPMQEGHSVVHSGNVMTSPGTATPLSAVSVPCKKVIVTAAGGSIVVGGSEVVFTSNNRKGTYLPTTNREPFYVDDLNKLYVDSATPTAVLVSYTYEN